MVGGMVTYNREIFNRCDDSVAHVVNQEVRILRRSRGYAPAPVRAGFQTEGIFAAGAELVNSFAIGKGTNVYMSQYIGDLKNLETFRFYKETYGRFCRMFRFSPGVVAHDLHPDYLSTRFAKDLAEDQPGIQLVPVQHHHAHIASVMLENGLDGEVIGFSFDGLGLGADGRIWGAEAMVAGYQGFRRFFHFEYVPLPGGDRANKEPWRMAVAYLSKYAGEGFRELPLSLFKEIEMKEIDTLVHMIELGANTPLISSAGRLFDAVAGMTGVNLRATYQAEAPMKLEALADHSEKRAYDYILQGETISFRPMILEVVEELKKGTAIRTISARFHNTLINAVLEMAGIIRKETGIKRVVLSGGTFQNRILTGRIEKGLISGGYRVIRASGIPVNDQGIAVGQLAIAAEKMKGL
jgi:hydrogenase maturation protein HypF